MSSSWPVGWQSSERAQPSAMRQTTPAQRLAWLDEAIEFAKRAGVKPGRLGRDGHVIAVREAVAADAEALVDLYESVAAEGRWIGGEVPIDRDRHVAGRLERIDDPTAVILVAEGDGQIVGELGMTTHGGRAELGMEIADGWRARGVGSALMDAAIAWARARDLDKIALQVWPHNDAARALYRKFGFEEEGLLRAHYRRRNGEAWDVIAMGLLLR